jgi:hypothetical protein
MSHPLFFVLIGMASFGLAIGIAAIEAEAHTRREMRRLERGRRRWDCDE